MNNFKNIAAPIQEDYFHLIFGDFTLDTSNMLISHISGIKIQLRLKEFQLLIFLYNHRNKIVNKTSLLELIWNYDLYSSTNTLEVHISSLRKKLESCSTQKVIQTVHGAGYRLIA